MSALVKKFSCSFVELFGLLSALVFVMRSDISYARLYVDCFLNIWNLNPVIVFGENCRSGFYTALALQILSSLFFFEKQAMHMYSRNLNSSRRDEISCPTAIAWASRTTARLTFRKEILTSNKQHKSRNIYNNRLDLPLHRLPTSNSCQKHTTVCSNFDMSKIVFKTPNDSSKQAKYQAWKADEARVFLPCCCTNSSPSFVISHPIPASKSFVS